MPEWLRQQLTSYTLYAGVSLLRWQFLIVAAALTISAIQWLLLGHASLVSTVIYAFFAGNIVTIIISLSGPLYDQPFPQDWIVYIALLIPASIAAGAFGGVMSCLAVGRLVSTLANWKSGDIPCASLICLVIGLVTRAFASNRAHLEAANDHLAQRVQYGRQELESPASGGGSIASGSGR